VRVENDAAGSNPHRRHANAYKEYVNFRATVRFETPWPGATVTCGPLEGYTIPNNSPVSGIWVRWEIGGDGLQTADTASSDALSRGGGGGGYTDSDGSATLKTETTFEPGCPNDDEVCAKGTLKKINSGAKAWLDLTRTPPVKIQDLLMGANPWKDAGKATIQVLTDVVTDIVSSTRGATSLVPVERHQIGRYRFKGTEKVGNFNIVVEGESVAGLHGPWNITWTARSTTAGFETELLLQESADTSGERGSQGVLTGDGTVAQKVRIDDFSAENHGSMTVNGTATIGGTEAQPTITLTWKEFDVKMKGIAFAGDDTFTTDAQSSAAGGRSNTNITVKGSGGGGSTAFSRTFANRSRTYALEEVK
jgi:hypothetical protein